MGRLGWPHEWDRRACPVLGCDRPAAGGEFPACVCERWLVRVLVVVVLLLAFLAAGYKGGGTMLEARADTWDDQVENTCPPGTEYRGYHRAVSPRCTSCVGVDGSSAWSAHSWGGRRCVGCGRCTGYPQYYRVCDGDDEWPRPACVDSPLSPDEEEDVEREGDILANLGGAAAAGGNPFGLGGGGGSQAPLDLFGDPVGAVEADDVVPQVETGDGTGEFECPAGTTLLTTGDNEGMCAVTDQCAFYGATGGSWPDCTCHAYLGTLDLSGYPQATQDAFAGSIWHWDPYVLRCMPREDSSGSVAPLETPSSRAGGSYLWNLICDFDASNPSSRGYLSAEAYLTQSSPVFVVRRGGLDVQAYGSATTLTAGVGTDDWTVSSDEAGDENTFGAVMCQWLAGPMSSVEGAFAGFGIAARAHRCPALSIPFFSQSIRLDVHCTLIGRWLGLIQALAVVGYSFLGVRYIWGMKGFAKPVQSA